jgi:hypothetical protein
MARTQEQSDRVDAIMAKVSGGEPKPQDYTEAERGQLMRTFNWYSYEKDRKDALAYVRAWMKKNDAKRVPKWDRIDANVFVPTYGWVARMLTQGSTFPTDIMERFRSHLDFCMDSAEPEAAPAAAEPVANNKKSIQEAMAEKQAEFLGDIEGEIDAIMDNDYKDTGFSLYKYCQGNNTARQYMSAVMALARRRIQELEQIGADEQITQAFNHLNRRQVKFMISFYQTLIEDADKYENFKKANRRPRAKKQKPAGEQVAKMKYLKNHAELGLESVMAATIIGANQLWVYNIKNKKLGVYHAMGPAGFTVKGTSLQGYDPEQSVQRTLRKPAEVLPRVLTSGKIALRRILTDLSTTETALNGRINEDTILLRSIS